MTFPFAWNEHADQPHNVAPRRERFKHHLNHAGSYIQLAASSLALAVPVLQRYRSYQKNLFQKPVEIGKPFGLSCSPTEEGSEEVVANLKEAGIRQTLIRLPSWEKENLHRYEKFIRLLRRENIEVTLALLQRREDVVNTDSWRDFLRDVYAGFSSLCPFFEVGHAWNRTKWGVWDHREYISLVREAVPLARRYGVGLIGPAVIDFEFHLYPPVLRNIAFKKVSSLLYVDRTGAPENTQFGWTAAQKVALLRSIVDFSGHRDTDCWITEVNWPLRGTGKYSPAPGKPSVTEEEQANYLVRYFVICLATGLIQRIYWWQLVAPGYGLIDCREKPWRKRPSFFALREMTRNLEESRFVGMAEDRRAKICFFRKGEEDFAVCWTQRGAVEFAFSRKVKRILGRGGEEIRPVSQKIKIEESPIYVFFDDSSV